jgi:ABC-type Fe3+-hydroxamate transport system substrate-binding protein
MASCTMRSRMQQEHWRQRCHSKPAHRRRRHPLYQTLLKRRPVRSCVHRTATQRCVDRYAPHPDLQVNDSVMLAPVLTTPPSTCHPRAHPQILAEGRKLSQGAYERSIALHPEVAFEPAGGPMHEVVPPQAQPQAQKQSSGKYHVVVTGDCGLYGRWQMLVRLRADAQLLGQAFRKQCKAPALDHLLVHASALLQISMPCLKSLL